MISWKDYTNDKIDQLELKTIPIESPIVCPQCGGPIYKDTSIILTSNPPQYRYFCKECDWFEYFF